MPIYSPNSQKCYETLHIDLQRIFFCVLMQGFEHRILCGHRKEDAQNEAYKAGFSKVTFPNSRHNILPSEAVDALPFPIEYKALEEGDKLAIVRVGLFAGVVLETAHQMGINIRWGGDWNRNWDVRDQNFNDWAHYELCGGIDGNRRFGV